VLLVNVRAYDTAVREKIMGAIERIVIGECEAGACPQEPEFDHFVPYTFWGYGGFLPGTRAVPNHNPGFAPAIQPTLRTATEAVVVAALAYLRTTG
jgi:hippurate hydrolase